MQIIRANPKFDTINFVMKDHVKTSGYISKNKTDYKLPLVIYFEGNTEEVSHLMDKQKYFENSVVALINYRGFGLSEGKPTEKTMFSDAVEVYDKLKHRSDIDTNRIIVIGRSIGTGVATYLSSQRKVAETILITPYDSMIDLAQEKYPLFPIFMIIKHPFESNKYAQSITSSMLALIAKNDVVIPTKHAFNLMHAWSGQTSYLEVDEDHSSIMDNELVWKKIEENINKK
jgi:pimeloyl-ACP methyl ester carboxylesterase